MRNPLGSTVSTAMHSSSVPRQPPPAAASLPRYYQGRAAAADSFGAAAAAPAGTRRQGRAAAADSFGAAAAAPAGSRRLQAVSEQIGSVSRELTAQQIGAFRKLSPPQLRHTPIALSSSGKSQLAINQLALQC